MKVFNQCVEGGVVSPSNCIYLDAWSKIDVEYEVDGLVAGGLPDGGVIEMEIE